MGAKKQLNLEQAMEKLEEITRQMDDETDLEKAMILYEEGVKLSKYCYEKLEEYSGRIEQVTMQAEGYKLTPLDREEL